MNSFIQGARVYEITDLPSSLAAYKANGISRKRTIQLTGYIQSILMQMLIIN